LENIKQRWFPRCYK